MHSKRYKNLFFRCVRIILIMTVFLGFAYGGELSLDLHAIMTDVSPDSMIRVIILFNENYAAMSDARAMTLDGYSLAERHREVVRTLREVADNSQKPVLDKLENLRRKGDVAHYRSFWIDNMIAAGIKAGKIQEIAGDEVVYRVYPDYRIELIRAVETYPAESGERSVETGIERINAPLLWQMGIYGEGSIVMNIDSGVDADHPALQARWHGNFVPPSQAWLDPTNPNSNYPTDTYWVTGGHGTHTMGTMCGATLTDTIGVAPGAHWIAAGEFFDESGQAFVSDVIASFQWAADPDGNPETFDDVPDVISNSWGLNNSTSPSAPPCDDTFWQFIDNAEAAGAAVVFAAGNEGSYGSETIRRPADRITTDVNVMAVGAVDGSSPSLPIAYFSSRGPSGCDHSTIKPEVVAPGVNVRSSVPGGGYEYMSGTSMACPHVAGAIALLRDLSPMAPPEAVKMALYMTAQDLGNPGEDNIYGNGFIDLYQAAQYLSNGFARIEGVVTDSISGEPLEGVRIRLLSIGEEIYTDVNGYFTLTTVAGAYIIEADRFDYFPFSDFVDLPADSVVNFDISLTQKPTGVVMGIVRDKFTDLPIHSAMDVLYDESIVFSTVSDSATGFYNLSLPGGTYALILRPVIPYPDEVNIPIEVVPDITQNLNIELTQADILLWNPSGQTLAIGNLEKALHGNEKTTRKTRALTLFNTLTGFDAVFCLMGVQPDVFYLSPGSDEEQLLRNYLNTGGNLYLEGGDFWSVNPLTDIHSYFFIEASSGGSGDIGNVEGLNFLDSLDYTYAEWADNNSIDRLQAVGTAVVIHRNQSPQYACGIAYDGGNYKTIGNSFLLGGLESDSLSLDDLISKYLDFFDIYGLCAVGDINDDGDINVIDVVNGVNIVLEINPDPDEVETCAADINDDGDINITDIIGLIQIVLDSI